MSENKEKLLEIEVFKIFFNFWSCPPDNKSLVMGLAAMSMPAEC